MPEHFRQVSKRAGLRKDVYSAEFARPKGCFGFGMSREDHHRQIRESASDPRKNGQTIESRHDEIEEDTIDGRGFDHVERFDSVKGHKDVMPFDPQDLGEHLGDRRIVFNNQYAHRRLRGGSIRAEGFARQGLTFGSIHAI